MKKIIITAIAASTLGMIASCTKSNGVQPASVQSQSVASDKSDVGSGDSAGGSLTTTDGSTTVSTATATATTTTTTTKKNGK